MQARIRANACRVNLTQHEGVTYRTLVFEEQPKSWVEVGPFSPEAFDELVRGLTSGDQEDAAARAEARSKIVAPPGGLKLN